MQENKKKGIEWLKTVKYLNIGQNKDPLKRNGLDLMPNIEVEKDMRKCMEKTNIII